MEELADRTRCAAAMVEATAAGAARGGSSRQAAAAMVAAAIRTASGVFGLVEGTFLTAEVAERTASIGSALELHRILDKSNGRHCHSLGGALAT